VYFAPRLNEGIGFGFLDAMACGMVVLSHNGPTMNEYIKHRINGLLFENLLDPLAETKIYDNPSELQKMGLAARETIRRANQHWRQQEGQILDFLKVVFDQTSNQCGSKDIPDSLMNNLRYCLVDIDDFIRLANQ
jgi:glycosyltransferase involved in cell wall biosynthesis